ncbi:hypothetical protein [Mycobacterium sp.]|uniref:hypothetical protein n=1 Tax=Mycobacterium sp. TaxID=1785 RepID=UPI00261E7640|nr:hypothetical protein [Mycobacterium sp.]
MHWYARSKRKRDTHWGQEFGGEVVAVCGITFRLLMPIERPEWKFICPVCWEDPYRPLVD